MERVSRRRLGVAVCALSISVVAAACGGSSDDGSKNSKEYAKSAEAACEAASEEGQLDYWSASEADQFKKEVAPFAAEHPDIKINFTSSRPDEVTQRIVTEVQAGRQPSADATTSDLASAEPLVKQGIVARVDYEQLGIDTSLLKKIGDINAFRVYRDPLGIAYNTEQMSASDVPDTWDELASTKWARKIMIDPRGVYVAGLSAEWGEDKMMDWFEKFLKEAKPVVIRGATASLQKVATGEIPMSTSATTSAVLEQQALGAPIDVKYLETVTAEEKYGMVFSNAKHPNAAACFMSWWGSKEGQAQQLKVEFKTNDDQPEGLPEGAKFSIADTPETEATQTRVAQAISDELGK